MCIGVVNIRLIININNHATVSELCTNVIGLTPLMLIFNWKATDNRSLTGSITKYFRTNFRIPKQPTRLAINQTTA
jgi:hypothetical protein